MQETRVNAEVARVEKVELLHVSYKETEQSLEDNKESAEINTYGSLFEQHLKAQRKQCNQQQQQQQRGLQRTYMSAARGFFW